MKEKVEETSEESMTLLRRSQLEFYFFFMQGEKMSAVLITGIWISLSCRKEMRLKEIKSNIIP